jgi:glycine cleavage system transcriptional repressor
VSTALVSIICEDRPGLIAAVTGLLFDLGINLADTTFAVLGGGAEFTLVAKLPERLALAELESELAALPELSAAKLTVTPFSYRESHDERARITHRIEIVGEDSPGLLARLSEVFVGYGANIVRLNSERIPSTSASSAARFASRFAVSIPAEKAQACLATVANTAAELHHSCHWVAT